MQCPKCGSENIKIDMVTTRIKTNNTSCLRSIGRGCLILFTFGLWLLVPSRNSNSKVKNEKTALCQDCRHSWKV